MSAAIRTGMDSSMGGCDDICNDMGSRVVIPHARRGLFVLSIAALMSAALGLRAREADAKEEMGPLAKLRRTDAELRAVVNRRIPDWSPEAAVRQRQIERLLGGLIDYDAIARVALGSTFSALAPERRSAFVATFAALTRQTFVARIENQKTHTTYEAETIDGSAAHVTATACAPGAAPSAGSRIEYLLERKGSDWLVTDVIVDGTSLVASYQRQFRRLVAREGMDGLMERMRDQLASATPN